MAVSPPSSVDRALQLVTLLAERGELRVHDAASELGVAPSTAHRLLAALRDRGFAVQDRSRVYHPGPALPGVAAAPTGHGLAAAAAPHLTTLAAATGETVHLMVLEGVGARFVDGVDGVHALRVARRVGMVLPAHVTSGGKVLLAELNRAQLGALYPSGLPLTPVAAGPDLATLRRELSSVRRRGYAINAEQSEQGVNAIGACVRDRHRAAVAAVVLAAPSLRMPIRRLVELAPLLLETAADIGRALTAAQDSR